MEYSDPTIIKLKTGDDIIATVRGVTKTRMVLENPFTLETLTLIDQNGVPRDERILMKKWTNWTKDGVISTKSTYLRLHGTERQGNRSLSYGIEEWRHLQDECNRTG